MDPVAIAQKICVLILLRRLRRRRKIRTLYARPLFLAKNVMGESIIFRHLEEDIFYHHKYYRMNMESLEILMLKVGPKLTHPENHRIPITAKQRLAVTLRYLATGNTQVSLAISHLISPSSLFVIIPEVLDAIISALQESHLPVPTTESWKDSAQQFWQRWNLPNCVGAIDGKHVRVKCQKKSGSNFYNYKKYYSIILMAVADARYHFSYVDVGAYGSEADSTIFAKSSFGTSLDQGTMKLPEAAVFPGMPSSTKPVPHVFVADDAFPLKTYVMRPFGGSGLAEIQHGFNYRLSRARRVVDYAFGILAAKWRIFHTPINTKPEIVDKKWQLAACIIT